MLRHTAVLAALLLLLLPVVVVVVVRRQLQRRQLDQGRCSVRLILCCACS